jgi:predicted alpha/beta-fold hydrolase
VNLFTFVEVHAHTLHRRHASAPLLQPLPDSAPVLILLPGLTGGSDDTYVRFAARDAEAAGMRTVVFTARGCGDTMLTTPQFYSALFIGDMEQVVAHVRALYPDSLLFATGYAMRSLLLRACGDSAHVSCSALDEVSVPVSV